MNLVYRMVKNGYPVLFWDNFGNSAPILTILSLLQAEIYGALRWSSSTHYTFIVWPPYLANQTLLLISVLSVYTSVATSWCRSEYLVWGRQGWSSSILEWSEKVNSSYYCNIVLEEGLLPDIRAICRHYRWTLQQEKSCSAHRTPAHTARTTIDYLKKEHKLHSTSHVASK